MYKLIFSSIIILLSQIAVANTVVLLNGMTETNTWKSTNISANLSKEHKVTVIRLPYRESIQFQSSYLNDALKKIDGGVILVAHSAGGLVARNVLVRTKNPKIKSLITIASPHSGSDLAVYGAILNDQIPFGNMFSRIMLPAEASAYKPLRQLKNKSVFLRDLNNRHHPNACYISIVKTGGYINNSYANIASQNMNNVSGLISSGNFSGLQYSNTGHSLHPSDSAIIHNSITACEKFINTQSS